jgi:protein-disulfide isomerase
VSETHGEGQRAARRRLREQRERDKAREKHRRLLMAGAVVVAALGIAAAVGVAVTQSGNGDSGGAVIVPTGANGEDGLAIPVGRAGAPSTLTVYEDFRCPACAHFENTFRDTIHELQDKGRLRTEYHLATVIDGNMGGSGSRNAANAAACAQDAGKFQPYHDVLYTSQPPEPDDAFADNRHLIELAGQVDGLVTDAFIRCVNEGSHDGWVQQANSAFTSSGHQGTPTILLNGKNIYGDQQDPLTPEKLKKAVEKAATT